MTAFPYTWILNKHIFINTAKKGVSLITTSEIAFGHGNNRGIFLGIKTVENSNKNVSPYSSFDRLLSFLVMLVGYFFYFLILASLLYIIISIFALSFIEVFIGLIVTVIAFGAGVVIPIKCENYFISILPSKKGWKKLPYSEESIKIFKDHKVLLEKKG